MRPPPCWGETVEDLAARLVMNPTTLNRKLLGQWWASLEEILAWVLDLGIDVLPVVDSTDELLPPAGP